MVNSCCQLEFIFGGLVLLPSCLAIPLGLGKSLVLLLQGLKLFILSQCVLIFKHAAHSSDGRSLLCVVSLLLSQRSLLFFVLSFLLFYPRLLLGRLESDAILIQ